MSRFVFAALLLYTSALAAEPPLRFCASDELLRERLRDPEIAQQREALETAIRARLDMPATVRRLADPNYIIPTVVYVVHNGGVENISNQQINSQIAALNTVFSKHGVRFCLVPNGIKRVTSTVTDHLSSQDAVLKALPPVLPANKYLRIWVVKDIDNGSGVAGYATFPGSGALADDGIVMRYDVFGDKATCACNTLLPAYDKGQILVHEVGHYLNLYHPFQGGCSGTMPIDCATSGDRVCDTPQLALASSGCPISAPPLSCNGVNVALINNEMDYTNDNCRTSFTNGQVERMLATLDVARQSLVTPENLTATGVACAQGATASFTTDPNVCTSKLATFDGGNGATSYAWDFGDGSTGSGDPVSHIYTAPGIYDVTLTANFNGVTRTRVRQVFVTHCPSIANTQGQWYFGSTKVALDFSSGVPVAKTDNALSFVEEAVTESDTAGNLLFYSNGTAVMTRKHTPMPPGTTLNGYTSASNGMISLPDPANPKRYYLVYQTNNSKLQYAIVDFSDSAFPDGKLLMANVGLPSSNDSLSEGLTAVPKCGGGYWVIAHARGPSAVNEGFKVYALTATKFDFHTFYPYPGFANQGGVGYLKASPDGTMLVHMRIDLPAVLLSFDRVAGTLAVRAKLPLNHYSASFSPDSRLLYTSGSMTDPTGVVYQYDLTASSPETTATLVTASVPMLGATVALQLGPDQKLYVSNWNTTTDYISVIHFPNRRNTPAEPNACGFQLHGPSLGKVGPFGSPPNMIDALPPSTTASINYTISSCKTVKFTAPSCASSYLWTFGDGSTSTAQNPSHTYATNGIFAVKLTVNGSSTTTQVLDIGLANSTATIFGPSAICPATSATLARNYSVNGEPGLKYQWTATGGTIVGPATSDAVDVYWTNLPGTVTVTVTAIANGCTVSKTLAVKQDCNAVSGADLYIRDSNDDTGVEPNPTADPIYLSPDIWIRQSPDPNWQPYPFDANNPPWTPTPDGKAEYRDPRLGLPNYVYVRVTNRGTAPSTGTERLRAYWSSASTGLGWDGEWIDYVDDTCGPDQAFGMEITKPRLNAAKATQAERDEYRDAILAIATDPAFKFDVSYWLKQNQIHTASPMNWHSTPLFLPWHREYLNRYEALLQQANPKVKLLYWDWTTDPESSAPAYNFFTPDFMGKSGRGTGGIGASLPFFGPISPAVKRALSTSTVTGASSDLTLLSNVTFPGLASSVEHAPNYDSMTDYIGGAAGNISIPAAAAQDPFFFVLHANADRLWAQWQRAPSMPSRLDPATAYGSDGVNPNMQMAMAPWNGVANLNPWDTQANNHIVSKLPKHASVVTPPIYDTAPLTIPILAPGESVVLQIPWYPPNPKDYACVNEPEHFCLLARVETSEQGTFGMTVPEIYLVGFNTVQNNNIAWKNISVVDDFAGPGKKASVLVRNVFDVPVTAGLQFRDTLPASSFFNHGRITVDLTPTLYARWIEGGAIGTGIRPAPVKRRSVRTLAAGATTAPSTVEVLSPDAALKNIRMEPSETFAVAVDFKLKRDYQLRDGTVARWDMIQTGTPGDREEFVGGQRFEIPLDTLVLVKSGAQWRYRDSGVDPGPSWMQPGYDDSTWNEGPAELGFGDDPLTTVAPRTTVWFRHAFQVDDPAFYRNALLRLKRDDGAIVYLNGREIHRTNVPVRSAISGVQEDAFLPVPFDRALLGTGRNVLAVEIHQAPGAVDDVTFDLELTANRASTTFAPDVLFLSPADGVLVQRGDEVTVSLDALDSDGGAVTVALYLGSQLLGTDNTAPYEFRWNAIALGPQRFRAVATDDEGQQATAAFTATILFNTPPTVRLLEPADAKILLPGEVLQLSAEASDPGGSIARVEYYAKDARRFSARATLLGSSTVAPYRLTVMTIPEEAMIWAVAVDGGGERTQSVPVHVKAGSE